MTKRYLSPHEWYPVLVLGSDFYDLALPPKEFTDEELADLRRVSDEFEAWQIKIAERFGVERGWYNRLDNDDAA
jgi:hypothetical protein